MNGYLPGMESERRYPALSQWYMQPDLARRVVGWALRGVEHKTLRLLEPSCGDGALIAPMVEHSPSAYVLGIEIDRRRIDRCDVRFASCKRIELVEANFLTFTPQHGFDFAIANPPFENGQTERHIVHALAFAERVVCHCPLTTLAGQDRREGLWSTAYLKRLVIRQRPPEIRHRRRQDRDVHGRGRATTRRQAAKRTRCRV